MNKIPLYLTYDDVLLMPQRSKIRHRAEVDTSTQLTPEIKLKIPLISANMDTVTEAPMAIALARAGGLGVIHRFMSTEDQVKNVDQVTRSGGFIIENPYTLGPDEPVKSILEKIKQQTVSSYLVVDKNHKLLGLVTRRDVIFSGRFDQPVSKVMTPVGKLITVDNGITMIKAKRLFGLHKIEKLPVIKDGKVTGLVTAKSIENLENHSKATVDKNGRYICAAAVGVVGDFMDRAEALLSAGVAALVVDVAHGQSQVSLEAIAKLRKKFRDAQIIGGKNPVWNRYGHERMGWAISVNNPLTP
jgi:IMP dehydrogenase